MSSFHCRQRFIREHNLRVAPALGMERFGPAESVLLDVVSLNCWWELTELHANVAHSERPCVVALVRPGHQRTVGYPTQQRSKRKLQTSRPRTDALGPKPKMSDFPLLMIERTLLGDAHSSCTQAHRMSAFSTKLPNYFLRRVDGSLQSVPWLTSGRAVARKVGKARPFGFCLAPQ